jgi:hypothetical protein
MSPAIERKAQCECASAALHSISTEVHFLEGQGPDARRIGKSNLLLEVEDPLISASHERLD